MAQASPQAGQAGGTGGPGGGPQVNLVDPNCLTPARLELLRAEFQQKLNLPRGTKQEFQAQVIAKWQDREVPRLLERLFARVAPGARLPRGKEDRADATWTAFHAQS